MAKETKEKKKSTKVKEEPMMLKIKSHMDLVDDYETINRIVYLEDNVVTLESCTKAIKQLLALDAVMPGAPITLVINSFGGDVMAALSLIDVMNGIASPVHTVAMGVCMSAGTAIHANGEKGHRYLFPSTEMLIHPMTTFMIGPHNQEELSQAHKEHKRVLKKYRDLFLSKCPKENVNKVKTLMKKESYMNAADYIKLGLADALIDKIMFMPKPYMDAYKKELINILGIEEKPKKKKITKKK